MRLTDLHSFICGLVVASSGATHHGSDHPPPPESRSISMSLARPLWALVQPPTWPLQPARTACSSTQLGERGAQQCGVDAVGRHAGLCVGAAGMRAAA